MPKSCKKKFNKIRLPNLTLKVRAAAKRRMKTRIQNKFPTKEKRWTKKLNNNNILIATLLRHKDMKNQKFKLKI